MKIVIPGGSGQVGVILARAFMRDGHEVTVLSRQPRAAPWQTMSWDGRTLGPWADALNEADVVVNLAGHSVNCRYNAKNRARIIDSRIESTRVVGEAIAQCGAPPHTWLQAATATIYDSRFDAANDEATGIIGQDVASQPDTWRFSLGVATSWERALQEAKVPRTRKIALRSAMTMSPDQGGVLDALLGLVRCGLGGRVASGRQYVSWIHHRDFVNALYFLIANEKLDGAINITAPHPLSNDDFMAQLRSAWGTRIGLPVTAWMTELGAIAMGTESELVLKSRRVVPGILEREGFRFEHRTWHEAAGELTAAWRRLHHSGRSVRR